MIVANWMGLEHQGNHLHEKMEFGSECMIPHD